MKDKRSLRLNFIQCFLFTSPCIEHKFSCPIKYAQEIIDFVACWKTPQDIVNDLRQLDTVSSNYSERCLRVDIWYLRKGLSSSSGIQKNLTGCLDPEHSVMFQIILQALLDVESGRPCDLGAWNKDISPDFCNCTEEHHICADQAESYLLYDIDDIVEEFAGLPCGTVGSLVGKIKKAPIYELGALLKNQCV